VERSVANRYLVHVCGLRWWEGWVLDDGAAVVVGGGFLVVVGLSVVVGAGRVVVGGSVVAGGGLDHLVVQV
jgi:hypothetical protein